jgi:hypothetical protein
MSSCNKKAAVIPFKPDYDKSSTQYIKHQQTITDANDVQETTTEEQVPKLAKAASPYEILKFLSAFNCAQKNFSWTSSPKLFQKFPMHLDGYQFETWELITDGLNHNIPLFSTSLEHFKIELLEGYTYENQMDYLLAI